MSLDWVEDVLAFHRRFGCHTGARPGYPGHDVTLLRLRLLREEFAETVEAVGRGNLTDTADGLADLIYVSIGTALAFGVDLRPVWDAVHEANMAKDGGGKRGDGKVLKSKTWTPPDVAGVLARQGELR